MRVVTIVGNPRTPSRTRVAADRFGEVLEELGGSVATVDLALIPVGGLAHGEPEPEAKEALEAVLAADLVLIVTPVYKASYTGLLKLLLDNLPDQALRHKVVVSVIIAAWPGHFLVLEHALRPVLSALGATTPARGLLVVDTSIDRESASLPAEIVAEFRDLAQEAMRLASSLRS